MIRPFFSLAVLYFFTLTGLFAQDDPSAPRIPEPDSVAIFNGTQMETDDAIKNAQETVVTLLDSSEMHDPLKAALLSAAMPGLGQIYNQSYWKVPVVYGSMMTLGYLVHYFDYYYIKYRNAYSAQNDGNPNTINPLEGTREGNRLFERIEFFRRNRDYLMILTAGFYLLNVMEAHVDAHLQTFDLSDDLSLEIKPGIMAAAYSYQMGITLNIKFK